jgi:PadR family transcriptional regulator PadR
MKEATGIMLFSINTGLLDACVLAILSRGDEYGYRLTQEVKQVMDISESTLYPVLRRLQKNGWLTTYDEPYQGRNRRYYRITNAGLEQHRLYLNEWKEYRKRIEEIFGGETTV